MKGKRSNLKLSLAGVTRAMELDKKVKGKKIRWVLLQDIGKAVIRSDVPQQDVLGCSSGASGAVTSLFN